MQPSVGRHGIGVDTGNADESDDEHRESNLGRSEEMILVSIEIHRYH